MQYVGVFLHVGVPNAVKYAADPSRHITAISTTNLNVNQKAVAIIPFI